ncbi:efflux RND transporter permease subunit [Paludibaculum fermentans]|uniref:Efflux RND transporter permease subunit n=1 Tax=Paludibaculum fermentans TaxID=1473598 RepID=A0A7S7NVK2_PALFE|nr:CusA/CzcA family heavy metal efflux RND transporter [Paludibaculum fermentans]QOY90589.1 efflux RND transporter permease subunit [Paludibaculum fermentans]
MHSFIDWALRYRAIVLLGILLTIVFGVYSLQQLPIDAVPDITPNQVLVLTRAPSLSPIEVEQFLTFPIENAMTGLPGVERIQSVSKNGLSYVAVYFRENVETYFARRLVMERLPQARENIPAGMGSPEMGPIATGLGEVYQFKVSGAGRSLMELRSILDWEIAPKLRSVPGIVEVNTHGGALKAYEVQVDSEKLVAYHVSLEKLISSLEKNNANAGGAYLERMEQQSLVRGEALITSLADIERIVVGVSPTGTPILVSNLGEVRFAPMVRQGFATQDGKGEIVVGVAMMLIGENSRVVVDRVKQKLITIQKSLPPGVRVEPLYDRTELVRRTIGTVSRNLLEGGLLVVAVLLLLLGSFKGGVMVSLAIPLSMLAAFTGMVQANISGNLMSLGAIDFGLVVDGSVVMVENILRRLGHRKPGEESLDVIRHAAQEVARPTFFGILIIVLVYIPILTLRGVEGKMFRPMAITLLFALAASLVIALAVMPVLSSYVFRKQVVEKETWLMRKAGAAYGPMLRRTLRFPLVTAGLAALAFVVTLAIVPRLGAEFIPTLDEGSIVVMMYRVPGISVAESLHGNEIIENVLREFPEVQTVYCRTGRPEVATDPMAIDQSDVYVFLKPASEWPRKRTKEDLISSMKAKLEEHAPGAGYSFSQPIQMRMQELMEAGVRSDIAVKLYGDDLNILRQKADQIAAVVQRVPGAADVRAERVAGLPYLRIRIKRDALARHDLDAADVLNTVEAIGGKAVGQVVEGNKRFVMQIRFDEAHRSSIDAIRNLMVGDNEGHFIPMAQLADVFEESGPAQISRENAQRRISVEVNVRGRDLAGFVSEASRLVAAKVKLPAGYSIEWGGKFEQLDSASRRLAITVPIVLLLIFVLLYLNFGSAVPALLISLNVPLAAVGGILALYLRQMPFSISAGVGFIALFGIAVLNGIVLLTNVIAMRKGGAPLAEAVEAGARARLRPVMMTALVASLGFFPMAFSHGAGAEVQRPLATVVIGGLVSSTALTLLVLPAIYMMSEKRREARGKGAAETVQG